MRHRTLAGLAVALSSLAVAGAARAGPHRRDARPVAVEQYAASPAALPAPQIDGMGNPAVFSENVERRLERLTWQMEHEREYGIVESGVFNDFNARKQRVRQMVSQSAASGYVAPPRRHEIDRLVDDLQATVDDARVRNRAVLGGTYPEGYARPAPGAPASAP